MTEKEIIEEYKRKKALEEATARHSYQAQTSYNNFVEDLEKRRRDYYTSELQSEIKADTDADLVPLQEERQAQAQAGNTGYVGGTGDNLLLDNNNNFVEQPSPFDVSQVTYNTRQRYADEIMGNRKEYVSQLGEENYYKVLDQLETTDQTPDLGADYKSAKLALDADLAWSDYLESGTIADRQKAEKLSKEYEQFMEDNGYKVGNAPFLSQNAQYAPQMGYYLSTNIPAGLLAGATYIGTSFLSKSKTIAGLAAHGVWELASLGTGYEATRRMTQGAAYKTLLDMGVPEDTAKYWAQETAKQQAMVEVGPEAAEKLIGWAVAAFSSGSMPARILKGLLTSYGVNIAEESLEEFAQEWQQISAEKNALSEAGLDTSQYTPEYERGRALEAAGEAVPISMGLGALGGQVTQTATTVLVDKKNIQSIKQGYQSAINSLQEKNAELQNKLDNEKLTSKQRYETNKQIKANNKEIKYLQEQSSDENVESAYNQWKQFQEALKESQELRDSTKFVSVEYNDNINTTLENAQTKVREQFGNNEVQIEAETEITQAEKNLKDVIEKRTGKNVVFYSVFGLDNLGNIRGFVEDGNTIYIEAGQSAKDTIAAASHEMGHIIANDNKVLFDTFKSLAGAKLGTEGLYNKIVEMNNKTGTYKLQEGQRLTTKQQNYLLEEMFGDYLAEIASKAKNVKALENSTLSVFDRLKNYAKNLANEALGREQENTRISGYDYSGVSYAEGDILENADFEKQVMETLKSLKPTDQVKEATKTTEKILQDNKKVETKKVEEKSNAKTPAEGVRAKIEARYKEMRNKSTPESIRKMIAEELGVEYNGAKDNSRDAIRVRDMYETLKETKGKLPEEGVKLSARSQPKTDNEGVELSSQQVAKYKRSQARDLLGRLLELFHTQTDKSSSPFNKFNPPRNDRYKFRGQTVIYTTSSKDVSGSYAGVPSQIETVKKNRINSITAAKKFISENGQSWQYKFEKKGDEIHVWYDLYGNLRQYKGKNGETHYTGGPEKVFKTEEDFKRNFINWFLDNENVVAAEQKFWQYPMYMNVVHPYIRSAGGNQWKFVVANSMEEVERHAKTADLIFELNSGEKARDFEYAVSSPTTNKFEFAKKVFDTEKDFEQSLENDDREALRKAEGNHYKAVRDWYEHILEDLKAKEEKMPEGKTKEAFAYAHDWLKDHKDWFDMEVMMIFASDREPQDYRNVAHRMEKNIIDTMESENRLTKKETNDIVKDALRYNYEHDVAGLKTTARLAQEMYQTEMEQDFGGVLRNLKRKYIEDLQEQEFETQEERDEAREEFGKKFADDVLKEIEKYEDLKEIHDHLQKHPETLVQFFSYAPENMPGQVRQSDENLKIMHERGIGSVFDKRTLEEEIAVENTQLVQDLQEFASGFYYNTTQEEIIAVNGYDGVFIMDVLDYGKNTPEDEAHPADLYIAFDPRQVDLVDNKEPTNEPDMRYSIRKGETNRDQIINNQLNEIAKQDAKIASLKSTNKQQKQEIKDITKQAKKDNASYQRAVKNKGKQIEGLNIKGYRKDEKIAKLINTIEDKNVSIRAKQYDREFDRYARKSDLKFDSDDRFRYLALRFEKVKPTKAFKQVQEMRASLSELETNINRSLDLIREWFKDAVYKKLSPELKKEVDGFNKYYRKGATITARNLLSMQLTSEYLKNLQGKAILTNRVQKQILDDGEPIALADILKTKDEAREFINSVEALNEKIIEDRQKNIRNEAKQTFKEDLAKAKGDIEAEIPNSKSPTTTIKRANKQLMTFKTQTEALFGGKKDSGAMYLDNNVRNGLRRQRRFVSNIYKMLDDFTEGSTGFNGLLHRRQWNKDIQKATDHKSAYVKPVSGVPAMPLGVIMSFAAGRNDAQYMSHITGAITSAKVIAGDGFIMPKIEFKEGGGVLIPDEKLYRAGKIDEAYKRGQVYKLTLDQVDELINSLTPEQKKFAETIHDIYEYTGEAINEVSNRIYGYDLAQVKDYFPIRVAGNESIWEEVKSMDVKNMLNTYRNALASNVLFGNPQLKPRSEASFSPIYGENIVDTLQRTINNIGTFYGYAEALWKNDMFLNSGFEDGGIKVGPGEPKDTLRAALDYLDSDYLKDYKRLTNYIVGLERQPDGALRRWMGARTLTFNIGTWFTQPASFASTYRYYSQGRFWESLVKSHNIGGDSVNKQIKSYFEEQGIDTDGISNFDLMRMFVSEASPFLDVRGIGFRAPDLRGLIGKPWYDKLSPKMIELFDDMAVSTIARMQIYNTSLEETFGTEAYFEKLGNNLEQILSETQPDKADINKANMFRSDKGPLRTLTMFGQPANQLYNNITQTALELQYAMKNGTTEEKNKALGNFGKAVGSIIVGQVYVALVRATREAIRAKDDDDTEFWKRWLSNFIVAMASPTLIGDEIAGFIMSKAKFGSTQFYDFESPDTAIMNNVVDLAEKIKNMFDAELSPTKKVVDTIKAVGNVAPIDTRSVVHLTEGLLRGLFPGVYKAYSLQTNTNAYKSWAKTKSTPMSEFYTAYIATQNASLKKNYGYIEKSKTGSESSKKESIKRALNDVFNNDEEKVDKYMHGILFDYTD